MTATQRRTAERPQPIEEAAVKAALELFDAVAYGARNDPAALQALDMLLHDVKLALANPSGRKSRVLMRAVARYERASLRIPDPEAGK